MWYSKYGCAMLFNTYTLTCVRPLTFSPSHFLSLSPTFFFLLRSRLGPNPCPDASQITTPVIVLVNNRFPCDKNPGHIKSMLFGTFQYDIAWIKIDIAYIKTFF